MLNIILLCLCWHYAYAHVLWFNDLVDTHISGPLGFCPRSHGWMNNDNPEFYILFITYMNFEQYVALMGNILRNDFLL